jgi:SPP1 family predicted phage head-tail adaptor
MYFSDQITLRAIARDTLDDYGEAVETYTDTVVWANVQSVKRSEFYAANTNGINATMAFEIHVEDWDNQEEVICDGKYYVVIRSYQKGLGTVELTCSDKTE